MQHRDYLERLLEYSSLLDLEWSLKYKVAVNSSVYFSSFLQKENTSVLLHLCTYNNLDENSDRVFYLFIFWGVKF